jgi:cobalt/nickel transport system ATP-binding protein
VNAPAISVRGLLHRFPDGTVVDLRRFVLEVAAGERVAFLGGNGSGKSTVVHAAVGLQRPAEGEVRVFGADPGREWPRLRARVGVVMQHVDDQLLGLTALDDVELGLRAHEPDRARRRERARAALARLGAGALADRVPHALSGGEKRRVAVAGALAHGPDLLVLDEVFGALDLGARDEVLGTLLEEHRARGATLLIVTHDVAWCPEFADRAVVLLRGREPWSGPPLGLVSPAGIEALEEAGLEPPPLFLLAARLAAETGRAPPSARTADLLEFCRGASGVREVESRAPGG